MIFIKKTAKYLFIFITLTLIALPYAAKFGAIYYLENEKNIKTNINDISFNIFTGKIELEGVHLYGEERGELHLGKLFIDISTTALFKKNILVESIEFKNFSSNITEQSDGWNIGGLFIPNVPADVKTNKKESSVENDGLGGLGIGIESIDFSSIKVKVSSQYTDSHFTINTLKINDLMSWQPSTPSAIEIDLSINDKSFSINGEARPFASEPTLKTTITLNDIQIKPFLKSLKDLPFKEADVAIFSDFELEITKKEENIAVKLNGNYGLKNIYLEDNVRKINVDKLMWQGQHSILLPISDADKNSEKNTKKIALDGLLSIDEISIRDSENNVHITQEKLTLSGKYNILLDDKSELPKIKATMLLALNKFNINTLDNTIKIASFDSWKTENINVININDVTIQQSQLNNLIVLENNSTKKTPAVTQLKTLAINDIHYKPESIQINKISLKQLNIAIVLDEKSELPIISAITPKAKNTSPPTDQAKTENKKAPETSNVPITITLNKFSINQNSNIRFIDNSVTPTFSTNIHDLNLLVTNINSSNKSSLTGIGLNIKIDEYGTFEIKGNAQPFTDKANANITAKLNGLELVPLSSYAAKFAGINIKRGTLDFDADIKVKEDILDVNNTFHLNKLIVESGDSEIKNNIFKDMPMPLDLTLDVLRDKNNIIKLDIPIKGDVDNPDFSLQDIYNTAMVKAMKFAATHYLTQAIQPLGLIITAGKLIGKATAPSFDPLVFDAGTAQISKTNKKHIKKLAKILQEKNKLKFTICGIATESDWKFIQAQNKSNKSEKDKNSDTKEVAASKKKGNVQNKRTKILLQLANQRTKQVKKHFIEEYEIKPSRLFICNGKIYKDKKGKPAIPSVEIGL